MIQVAAEGSVLDTFAKRELASVRNKMGYLARIDVPDVTVYALYGARRDRTLGIYEPNSRTVLIHYGAWGVADDATEPSEEVAAVARAVIAHELCHAADVKRGRHPHGESFEKLTHRAARVLHYNPPISRHLPRRGCGVHPRCWPGIGAHLLVSPTREPSAPAGVDCADRGFAPPPLKPARVPCSLQSALFLMLPLASMAMDRLRGPARTRPTQRRSLNRWN